MTSIQQEIFQCVLSGDLETMKEHLESEGAAEEDQDENLFSLTDEAGRNALLTACMLGRSALVRELLAHGARVNRRTVRGYSPLHLAACWGHVDTVRTLLELGADTQGHTFRGERPIDLSRKYSKTDCTRLLVVADAQQDLMSYVAFVKDLISDPEKNLTKEEKNTCTRACSAKSDWLQSFKFPTLSEVTAQRKDLEGTLQPVLSKLAAQS